MYSSDNNGYGVSHYSNTSRQAEADLDQKFASLECQKAGTHRFVTQDGAYRMVCESCGETYLREHAIFR